MPVNVIISGVTGQSPYNVYICDENVINCTWVSQITSGQIPYSFELPFFYQSTSDFAVKLIESNGCSVIKLSGTTYAECL
jgi:hypothetical protein